MRFFAVAMATDEPIGLKLKRALFEAKFNCATKFGQDRLVRLCSRAVRKSNGTDRQTDKPGGEEDLCRSGGLNGNPACQEKNRNMFRRPRMELSNEDRTGLVS